LQVLSRQKRLQLLEQDENDADFVIAAQMLHRCLLNTLDIHCFLLSVFLGCGEASLLFENVGLLAHQIFQELSQHQSSTLIFFFLAAELVIDFQAVVLHLFVARLRLSQFFLDFFEFHLQKVDQLLAL